MSAHPRCRRLVEAQWRLRGGETGAETRRLNATRRWQLLGKDEARRYLRGSKARRRLGGSMARWWLHGNKSRRRPKGADTTRRRSQYGLTELEGRGVHGGLKRSPAAAQDAATVGAVRSGNSLAMAHKGYDPEAALERRRWRLNRGGDPAAIRGRLSGRFNRAEGRLKLRPRGGEGEAGLSEAGAVWPRRRRLSGNDGSSWRRRWFGGDVIREWRLRIRINVGEGGSPLAR